MAAEVPPTVHNGTDSAEATDVGPKSPVEVVAPSVEAEQLQSTPAATIEQRALEQVEGIENVQSGGETVEKRSAPIWNPSAHAQIENLRSGGQAVEKRSAPVWNPSAHAQVVAEPVICVPPEDRQCAAPPRPPAEREDATPTQPLPVVPKKKKTRVSAGLTLRKKNIPSLLEKWEKIKEEQEQQDL